MTGPARLAPGLGERGPLRAIAAFEALKGVLALAASLGFLGLMHHDLHQLAAALIGHIGLDPGDHYPALVLSNIDQLRNADLTPLLLAAFAYVLVRFIEAFGLWHGRPWAAWLGALSGGVYIPFELRHLLRSPTAASAVVIVVNLAVVGFLAWRLWRRRHARAPGD